MKSILQTEKECYLCRIKAEKIGYCGELSPYNLHRHHIVFGTSGRKLSEKYGLWVYVCEEKHHEHGPESPHQNIEVKNFLIREAQKKYEESNSHEEWMSIFGRNWL